MKLFKWIILAITATTLAKCGYDEIVYNGSPQIDPNPTKKVRIHGKFPFDKNVTLRFDVKYINTNPKCNKVVRTFGFIDYIGKKSIISEGAKAIINKDGYYEAIVYTDSYLAGVCKYKPLIITADFDDGKKHYEITKDFFSTTMTEISRNPYSGAVVARFVDKNITKQPAIEVVCDLLKNQYEWAKKENAFGFDCRLKEDKYIINPHTTSDLFEWDSEEYLELQESQGWKYYEIPKNQNDIEVNFNFKGEKQ